LGLTPGYWKNHLDWPLPFVSGYQEEGGGGGGGKKGKGGGGGTETVYVGGGTLFHDLGGTDPAWDLFTPPGAFAVGAVENFGDITMFEVIDGFTNTLGAHAVAHVLNAVNDPSGFGQAVTVEDVVEAYNQYQSGAITRAYLMNLWLTLEGEPIEIELG
jgi:hypothetical protein